MASQQRGGYSGGALHPPGLGRKLRRIGSVLHVVPAHARLNAHGPVEDVVEDDESEVKMRRIGCAGVQAEKEVGYAGSAAALADVVPEPGIPAAGQPARGECPGGPQGPPQPARVAGQLVQPAMRQPSPGGPLQKPSV